MLRRVLQPLGPHHTLQNRVRLRVRVVVVNHARAVDQEDPLRQRDVLPHLGLPWDRGHVANLLGPQRVDHRGLANVRVPDKPNRDGLLVAVKPGDLPEQRDQGTLAERIGDGRVEGQGWVVLGKQVQVPASTRGGKRGRERDELPSATLKARGE